jgi:hypothetical protein
MNWSVQRLAVFAFSTNVPALQAITGGSLRSIILSKGTFSVKLAARFPRVNCPSSALSRYCSRSAGTTQARTDAADRGYRGFAGVMSRKLPTT